MGRGREDGNGIYDREREKWEKNKWKNAMQHIDYFVNDIYLYLLTFIHTCIYIYYIYYIYIVYPTVYMLNESKKSVQT